ncbi:predicted protein [Naegleria gruberi]|uniref:Predicted protein n=1 Tax=Naegleria gruberi TaxID=5762 RepID=D2VN76_NAEGR|nr:uncharacterized protein NAEGRDRAFT_70397 [Naegleria gruberi]EFC41694.1 predicted protein [Naegleria gruberi]|eukprot:XP_002674438.1 predicted protein [Naegleria gruberi strain NEG-M]
MFAEIMEKYCDRFWVDSGDTIINFIPLEAVCVKDRELLLRLISVYNGMFAAGSEELRGDKEIVRAMLKSKFQTFHVLEFLADKLASDIEFILEIVESDHRYLCGVDEDLLKSEDFMSKAVQKSIYSIESADESLLYNEEWFKKVLQENKHVFLAVNDIDILGYHIEDPYKNSKFEDLPFEIRNDKCKMIQVLKTNGYCLKFISDQLKLDREITLCAVINDGLSLEFADESFRKDKEIVEKACISKSQSFQFAHKSLMEDPEFVLKLIEIDHCIFSLASIKLKSDPEFCLRYLSIDPKLRKTLECSELGSNREFIMDALQIICENKPYDCLFVDLLNEKLRNDKELILISLRVDIENYEFISPQLKQDKDILLFMAQKCRKITDIEVPEYMKNDREFVRALLSNDRCNDGWLEIIPPHFLEEEALVDEMLNNHPSLIECFPPEKQLDLIRKHPVSLIYSSSEMQIELIDLLIEVMQKYPNYFDYIDHQIQQAIYEKDKQTVVEVCKKNTYLIQHLALKVKSDPEIVLSCINKFETAFQFYSFVPHEIMEDWEFNLRAVRSCGFLYHYSRFTDETLELEALKQCGYFSLESLDTMQAEYIKDLLFKRMKLSYSSDFYLPKYFTTLDFL